MENASKALLMAGGMLLAILLITVLMYAWSLFSKYQSSQDSLIEIEDTAKFNQQFTNYDRTDVQGYELLSLLNQVIDYNTRKSYSSTKSYEKNSPIKLKIYMGSAPNLKGLTNDKVNRLFTNDVLELSDMEKIQKDVKEIIVKFGSEDSCTKIAKNIDSIFMSSDEIKTQKSISKKSEEQIEEDAINKFKSYCKNNSLNNSITTYGYLQSYKSKILIYYEYMQFKRGIFECKKLEYDNNTGRVSNIEFKFTGKIH